MSSPLTIEMAQASLSMADVPLEAVMAAKKASTSRHFWNSLSYGLALAATATAILAMLFYGSPLVYASMSLSLLLASSVTVQRFKLSRRQTLRQVMNLVRAQVNRLQRENNSLTRSIDKLQHEQSQLKQMEQNLDTLTQQQGTNTNTFLYEVKQNKLVQEEIQKYLIQNVTQDMLSALLRADRNQDFEINPHEVDVLIARVKSIPGVQHVDEARIKEILLKKGSGLEAILEVVADLTTPPKDGTKALVQVSASGLVLPPQ